MSTPQLETRGFPATFLQCMPSSRMQYWSGLYLDHSGTIRLHGIVPNPRGQRAPRMRSNDAVDPLPLPPAFPHVLVARRRKIGGALPDPTRRTPSLADLTPPSQCRHSRVRAASPS